MILLMTLFCTNFKIYDFHFSKFFWIPRGIVVNRKFKQNISEHFEKIFSRYLAHKQAWPVPNGLSPVLCVCMFQIMKGFSDNLKYMYYILKDKRSCYSEYSRSVLSNTLTTSHRWLFLYKITFLTVKNSVLHLC